jgi:hypothetical protein
MIIVAIDFVNSRLGDHSWASKSKTDGLTTGSMWKGVFEWRGDQVRRERVMYDRTAKQRGREGWREMVKCIDPINQQQIKRLCESRHYKKKKEATILQLEDIEGVADERTKQRCDLVHWKHLRQILAGKTEDGNEIKGRGSERAKRKRLLFVLSMSRALPWMTPHARSPTNFIPSTR